MAAGNSVWDEIREQNRKMKGRPFKEKFAYFWEYYRNITIISIIAILFIGNLIYTMVTATDNGLGVVMINGYTDMDVVSYMISFEEYSEMDTKEYSANMEANFILDPEDYSEYVMANIQKFTAMISANQLDVAFGDQDTILGYAESGYFYDLNDIFPDELLAGYQDKLIYFDIPDDDKEGEVPVGINVTDTRLIRETLAYGDKDAYFAVIGNSQNIDNVLKFFEYIKTAEVPFTE